MCGAIGVVTLMGGLCLAQAPYGDDQIEVVLGEPFTIISHPPTFAFPTLHQVGPKDLMLAVWTAPDASLPEAQQCQTVLWSEDEGKTWGKPATLRGKEAGGHSLVRRKDGTCIWLGYFTTPLQDKVVACSVGTSKDGRTFTWSPGKATFPEPVRRWDQGNAYMVFARSILELEDGSLIATMYGYFEGDGPKYRTLIVRSTDGGLTWDYLSTVAYDPNAPGEGYCEPVLVRTSDNDLLCVMRRGWKLALTACRSKDSGRTWSPPTMLPDYATCVFPDAVLMSNGVLAVSFGRPGCHLIFSVDGKGERWTSRKTLFEDPSAQATCAYTDIREVAPGRLLYVYSFLENNVKPGAESHIRGVFVDVKRK